MFAKTYNGGVVPISEIPECSMSVFRDQILTSTENGRRVAALFGYPLSAQKIQLVGVLTNDFLGEIQLIRTHVSESYRSMTPECPQVHFFERELAEQWGIIPHGHPWLKPVRFHLPYRHTQSIFPENKKRSPVIGKTDYYQVAGEEIHEVAVGPVHAGIIEPGHFRFQCHGEKVLHLEISLGYQHRGVERALLDGKLKRGLHLAETLAGDTTVGHAVTWCQAWEALCDIRVPARAQVWRGIALELERLANHTGDMGALAGDVAFLPTASYCGRLRGDFLNLTAAVCGNRFGRGWIRCGGVGFDVLCEQIEMLQKKLDEVARDVVGAISLLWKTPTVLARFEDVGRIPAETCRALGLVGVAARACGVERDVRSELPAGIYQFSQIPVSSWHTGDVFARAYVRWLEIQRSIQFVKEQLEMLREGSTLRESEQLPAPASLVVSFTEGWRGEICHVGITNEERQLQSYKIVDPSFHNWNGLAVALRGQQISDFPLCNKSFNLSYCGVDL